MSVSQKGLGEICSNFMYLMYQWANEAGIWSRSHIYSLGQDYEIGRDVCSHCTSSSGYHLVRTISRVQTICRVDGGNGQRQYFSVLSLESCPNFSIMQTLPLTQQLQISGRAELLLQFLSKTSSSKLVHSITLCNAFLLIKLINDVFILIKLLLF